VRTTSETVSEIVGILVYGLLGIWLCGCMGIWLCGYTSYRE
jgi:hypothetical protein